MVSLIGTTSVQIVESLVSHQDEACCRPRSDKVAMAHAFQEEQSFADRATEELRSELDFHLVLVVLEM